MAKLQGIKNAPAEPSSRPKPVYDSTDAIGKLSAVGVATQPPDQTILRALIEVFRALVVVHA